MVDNGMNIQGKKYTYTLERVIDEEFKKVATSEAWDGVDSLAEAKTAIMKEFYKYVEQRDRAQAAATKDVKDKILKIKEMLD